MKLRGRVIRRQYAPGSKSEHEAVMLQTTEATYRLRRVGANPFGDPQLDKLVGAEIIGEGNLHRDTFLLTGWQTITG
uniref:Uncharacterized protein n=1 Tax=Schlesneria paludicola TaxID=360056 RepID=A0A7C2NZD8_9PLAN